MAANGSYTCGSCGEQWPAGLYEAIQLEGCPACNPAWAGDPPKSDP